jgi:hypothetical protein
MAPKANPKKGLPKLPAATLPHSPRMITDQGKASSCFCV